MWLGFWYPELRDDGRAALRNAHVKNLMLGLLVKFFYVPLMVTWAFNEWSAWEFQSHNIIATWFSLAWDMPWDVARNVRSLQVALLGLIIAAEVTTATIAYIASFRVLDTQVTTAEPTLFGWTVAIICYPPFNQIWDVFLWRDVPEVWAPDCCLRFPVLTIVAGVLGIVLMGIYGYCTFCFGLRFSNLTNRGIVCSGPYRYVRHPAYISKNLAWWIGVLPAFADHPFNACVISFRMAVISLIYFTRAITEERHLMREPHYQEYCRKTPWRFIPGVW
jgi:protein-S-isoprenylcysteine O-methyltransferase Ste14